MLLGLSQYTHSYNFPPDYFASGLLCVANKKTGFHCSLQCDVLKIPGGNSGLLFQVTLSFPHLSLSVQLLVLLMTH